MVNMPWHFYDKYAYFKLQSFVRICRDIIIRANIANTIYIFTDRVRSTTVRYCFHRCLSVHTWRGVPQPGPDGGYPNVGIPPAKVGTPGQVQMGGTPR